MTDKTAHVQAGIDPLVAETPVRSWDYMPSYGKMRFDQLVEAVSEAVFADRRHKWRKDEIDPERFTGHQIVPTINFNSLNRIVSAFVLTERRSQAERIAALSEKVRHLEIDCQQWLVDYEERGNALSAERQLRKDAEAEREAWAKNALDNDDGRIAAEAEMAGLKARSEGLSELLDTTQACAEIISKRAEAAESLIAEAREALDLARKTMRNSRGAIESDQVDDKDVCRQLSRGIEAIDATLSRLKPGEKGGGE